MVQRLIDTFDFLEIIDIYPEEAILMAPTDSLGSAVTDDDASLELSAFVDQMNAMAPLDFEPLQNVTDSEMAELQFQQQLVMTDIHKPFTQQDDMTTVELDPGTC